MVQSYAPMLSGGHSAVKIILFFPCKFQKGFPFKMGFLIQCQTKKVKKNFRASSETERQGNEL